MDPSTTVFHVAGPYALRSYNISQKKANDKKVSDISKFAELNTTYLLKNGTAVETQSRPVNHKVSYTSSWQERARGASPEFGVKYQSSPNGWRQKKNAHHVSHFARLCYPETKMRH